MRTNLWNKLFHPKKLREYKEKRKQARRIIGWLPQMLYDLKDAKNLSELLDVHKDAWSKGFQNSNLSPCEWGMFRTKSIPEMTIDEVFLGNIFGLHTKNIRYWNQHSDATMGTSGWGHDSNTKIYDIIMNQYRSHLKSNFTAIADEATQFLFSKKK